MRLLIDQVCSEEEVLLNIPFGYLSVFICYLCLDDAIRHRVQERLPNSDLLPLFDAVQEFSRYHKAIENNLATDSFVDHQLSFADRVQRVLTDLKQAN